MRPFQFCCDVQIPPHACSKSNIERFSWKQLDSFSWLELYRVDVLDKLRPFVQWQRVVYEGLATPQTKCLSDYQAASEIFLPAPWDLSLLKSERLQDLQLPSLQSPPCHFSSVRPRRRRECLAGRMCCHCRLCWFITSCPSLWFPPSSAWIQMRSGMPRLFQALTLYKELFSGFNLIHLQAHRCFSWVIDYFPHKHLLVDSHQSSCFHFSVFNIVIWMLSRVRLCPCQRMITDSPAPCSHFGCHNFLS